MKPCKVIQLKNILRQHQEILFQEPDFQVSVPEPVQNDLPIRPENQKWQNLKRPRHLRKRIISLEDRSRVDRQPVDKPADPV